MLYDNMKTMNSDNKSCSMIKKQTFVLIVLLAMAAFVTPASAQMSDDAVMTYVEAGLANGKSQNELIKELAVKGVTKDQAERIKKKLESMHGTSSSVRKVGASDRARVSREVKQAVADDSLTVKRPVVDSTAVFGRNIFSIKSLTFAPSENIATPANYKLGPGDEVIVDIWGTNQTTIRQAISPDGFINVDGIGIVYLTGMTVKEAEAYMRRQLGRIYSVEGDDAQSDIKLTLGAIRTITVNVMGEVVVPGKIGRAHV